MFRFALKSAVAVVILLTLPRVAIPGDETVDTIHEPTVVPSQPTVTSTPDAQDRADPIGSGKIIVSVSALRNQSGMLRVAIFSQKKGFPANAKAVRWAKASPITELPMTLEFAGIPPGTYAVSALHDENNNNKLDTNWIGIPKEGFGVSNNRLRKFGPPKFSDAKFELGATPLTLPIVIHYY